MKMYIYYLHSISVHATYFLRGESVRAGGSYLTQQHNVNCQLSARLHQYILHFVRLEKASLDRVREMIELYLKLELELKYKSFNWFLSE